jgi:hypothetical protein
VPWWLKIAAAYDCPVPDQKPPRLAGGERDVVMALPCWEETSRHAGDADILRELTDGSTGR